MTPSPLRLVPNPRICHLRWWEKLPSANGLKEVPSFSSAQSTPFMSGRLGGGLLPPGFAVCDLSVLAGPSRETALIRPPALLRLRRVK